MGFLFSEGIYHIPNLLLISGTGRNSGKTLLACRIIEKFADTEVVFAVKITSHIHNPNPKNSRIINPGFIITEEKERSRKDSSRMLQSGAHRAFFIQIVNSQIKTALPELISLMPKKSPIICESASLREFVTPAIHLFMQGDENTAKNKDHLHKADRVFSLNQSLEIEQFMDSLIFTNNQFSLKE